MPKAGGTSARGYTWGHRKLRAVALADLRAHPGRACPHCGAPMTVEQRLDLDHTADRTGYRGLAHASCNRRDGGQKARRQQAPQPLPTSRRW